MSERVSLGWIAVKREPQPNGTPIIVGAADKFRTKGFLKVYTSRGYAINAARGYKQTTEEVEAEHVFLEVFAVAATEEDEKALGIGFVPEEKEPGENDYLGW